MCIHVYAYAPAYVHVYARACAYACARVYTSMQMMDMRTAYMHTHMAYMHMAHGTHVRTSYTHAHGVYAHGTHGRYACPPERPAHSARQRGRVHGTYGIWHMVYAYLPCIPYACTWESVQRTRRGSVAGAPRNVSLADCIHVSCTT